MLCTTEILSEKAQKDAKGTNRCNRVFNVTVNYFGARKPTDYKPGVRCNQSRCMRVPVTICPV